MWKGSGRKKWRYNLTYYHGICLKELTKTANNGDHVDVFWQKFEFRSMVFCSQWIVNEVIQCCVFKMPFINFHSSLEETGAIGVHPISPEFAKVSKTLFHSC